MITIMMSIPIESDRTMIFRRVFYYHYTQDESKITFLFKKKDKLDLITFLNFLEEDILESLTPIEDYLEKDYPFKMSVLLSSYPDDILPDIKRKEKYGAVCEISKSPPRLNYSSFNFNSLIKLAYEDLKNFLYTY